MQQHRDREHRDRFVLVVVVAVIVAGAVDEGDAVEHGVDEGARQKHADRQQLPGCAKAADRDARVEAMQQHRRQNTEGSNDKGDGTGKGHRLRQDVQDHQSADGDDDEAIDDGGQARLITQDRSEQGTDQQGQQTKDDGKHRLNLTRAIATINPVAVVYCVVARTMPEPR